MLNKKGWSALEYLLMTVAVVAAIIAGAQGIKSATTTHFNNIATQIESTNVHIAD
jgi:Flp pilus assembly pilin Flp